jgi:hypothetical protein
MANPGGEIASTEEVRNFPRDPLSISHRPSLSLSFLQAMNLILPPPPPPHAPLNVEVSFAPVAPTAYDPEGLPRASSPVEPPLSIPPSQPWNRGREPGGGWFEEPAEPEPLVAPVTTSLLQSVAKLQRMEQGRYLGYRAKRPLVRRAGHAIKWYCMNGPVMAVVAVYQMLGGCLIEETSLESIKTLVTEEIISLATVAFSGNQEALCEFISLFPI